MAFSWKQSTLFFSEMRQYSRFVVYNHGNVVSFASMLYTHCRSRSSLIHRHFASAAAVQTHQEHERHFVINSEHADLWQEHAALVIPHIAHKTSTNITVLGRPSHQTSKWSVGDNVLLLRSDSERNLDRCLSQIDEFLNQHIVEVRPSSLQPLLIPMMKYIRNKELQNPNALEMFVDSYSSQIYLRGDAQEKQTAMELLNKLLSPSHLRIFRYLFLCKNIVSKEMVQELCNKYHILWADNFANPRGSETIEYYMTSVHQSQMHFFLNEMAKIAQSKQRDQVQRILYLLRQSFVHHNISASMQIDLQTLLCIVHNVSLSIRRDVSANPLSNSEDIGIVDLFHRANFTVPPTANGDHKVTFTQLALALCLNDREKRYLDIEERLKQSYPEAHLSAWNAMFEDAKQARSRSVVDTANPILPTTSSSMIANSQSLNRMMLSKVKRQKMVTVSLRIGSDSDTMPLFIGKKGKNLKFIETASGLHHVHTSWLVTGSPESGGYKMGHKDDSITMKGTQQQIEEALRLCAAVLERIGKWYDKRKWKVLAESLMNEGVESDLDTFEQETFERALRRIPNVDLKKLFEAYDVKEGQFRILSFIRQKMGSHQGSAQMSNTNNIEGVLDKTNLENGVETKALRLVDMVYNYCASKTGKVWLINMGANFYCNVSPMIEFRECFPFIEPSTEPTVHSADSVRGDFHLSRCGQNQEILQKVDAFYAEITDKDVTALQGMAGQVVDEWHDMDSDTQRGKEIVVISSSTAMTLTESTTRQLFRHYASCGVRLLQSNEVELVGNEYERLMAKRLLMEPLFLHWNVGNNVGYLLGKKGKRIQNIEKFSGTKIEVVPLDDVNVQLMVRGLPSQQQNAKMLCEETQEILSTAIPRWSVSGVVGRHGKGLDKLQYISGADIYIDKSDVGDDVKVEIIGTKHQKAKALRLLQNWGTGTLRFRFEKFKLRVTEIPFEKDHKEAEVWVKQVLAPYCSVMGMDVMDYRDSHKKRSLAYFAFVWVDSFDGKMKAIRHLNNAHDINLKIWNGEPIGTVLAPSIPFDIEPEEFKRSIYGNYQNVTNIEIDTNTKIGRYSAYIEFDDRLSFRRACDHNLRVKGERVITFAAKQWQKELKSYRFDENEYKKEFACYLQYCLDQHFEHREEGERGLTLEELPAIYEEICNVPWIRLPKYSSNSFEHRILKMYVSEELDPRIWLSEKEKEFALKKYFYLKPDDGDEEEGTQSD